MGALKDRRIRVFVDRYNVLRVPHASDVLRRAGDAYRDIEIRRDRDARQSDLHLGWYPTFVDGSFGGSNCCPEELAQLFELLETFGALQATPTRNDDRRGGERDAFDRLLVPTDEFGTHDRGIDARRAGLFPWRVSSRGSGACVLGRTLAI